MGNSCTSPGSGAAFSFLPWHWHLTAGWLVPCKQQISCHCKQLVPKVVTVPKSRCDCPVTRYSATGPSHLILGKQHSENGQQRPARTARCRARGRSDSSPGPDPSAVNALFVWILKINISPGTCYLSAVPLSHQPALIFLGWGTGRSLINSVPILCNCGSRYSYLTQGLAEHSPVRDLEMALPLLKD